MSTQVSTSATTHLLKVTRDPKVTYKVAEGSVSAQHYTVSAHAPTPRTK
jgi:hypothetical protein